MAETIYSGLQPIFSDVPGFNFLGLMSPKRKSYLEAEAARTLGVVEDVFANTGAQLDGLDSIAATPEQRQQVQTLRSRLGVLGQMAVSGRPGLAEMSMTEYSKLNDDIDALGTQFAAAGIVADQAAIARDRNVVDASEKMRDTMTGELEQIRTGIDSFNVIQKITDVDSPFALTAAAYKTVDLLQSSGVVSDSDIAAAQSGIATWAQWFEQKLAAGAAGEGFLPEARNNLLKVLDPIATVAETKAAQIVGRYGAYADAGRGKYDREIVFAGFEPGQYRREPWQLSPEMTDEEKAAAADRRTDAARTQARETMRSVACAAGGAFRGLQDAAVEAGLPNVGTADPGNELVPIQIVNTDGLGRDLTNILENILSPRGNHYPEVSINIHTGELMVDGEPHELAIGARAALRDRARAAMGN